MNVLKRQYDLVKQSRELLFTYCERLNNNDYSKELEGFGVGSIRNLHAHVAECYQSWLGNFALKQQITMVNPYTVDNVDEMRHLFKETDTLVYKFLNQFEGQYEETLLGPVPWQENNEKLSILWLFTHTITHEFHHKGQIVSIGRHLGYIPSDTDLIVPIEHGLRSENLS